MTRSEYQELVEYLGPKFDAIDGRFEAIEARLTRLEVSHEETRHQVQTLAEGMTSLRREMREGFARVWSEFGVLRKEMAEEFKAQGKLITGLSVRMGRWEGHRA